MLGDAYTDKDVKTYWPLSIKINVKTPKYIKHLYATMI
jgi:hypothetical protein